MAVVRGRIQTLEISTDGGTVFVPIGKLLDPSLSIEVSEIATTTHDSGAFEESIPGRLNGTIDAPVRYDRSDPGQIAAVTSAFSQTIPIWRWRPEGAISGAENYQSSGWVKTIPLDSPNDDAANLALSIQLTGTITKGLVP